MEPVIEIDSEVETPDGKGRLVAKEKHNRRWRCYVYLEDVRTTAWYWQSELKLISSKPELL